jgi:hypothetical protein
MSQGPPGHGPFARLGRAPPIRMRDLICLRKWTSMLPPNVLKLYNADIKNASGAPLHLISPRYILNPTQCYFSERSRQSDVRQGQSRRFDDVRVTSAFSPIATKERTSRDLSKVPLADSCTAQSLLWRALHACPSGSEPRSGRVEPSSSNVSRTCASERLNYDARK